MSEPLRIGLVAEGITDKLVIQAAIKSLLGDRRFILRLLQPEESLPFELSPPTLSQGKRRSLLPGQDLGRNYPKPGDFPMTSSLLSAPRNQRTRDFWKLP